MADSPAGGARNPDRYPDRYPDRAGRESAVSAVSEADAVFGCERRDWIRAELRRRGMVRTGEVSRHWAVSPVTVRRDLAVLEAEGCALRVHGGAVGAEPPPRPAQATALPGVRAIAAEAAATVRPDSAVGLTGGPLAEALAEELVGREGLTVITNSLRIAAILDRRRGAPDVIITGGQRGPGDLLVGPLAVAAVDTVRLDAAYVDCVGAEPAAGLTVRDLDDAELRHHLFRAARRRVLLAEPAAFGTCSLAQFAALEEVDAVCTDPDGAAASAAGRAVLGAVPGSMPACAAAN
ncbi:DeoR/GlpR family DNA-binding transcription regulator [Kitasatospora sp. NPDC006697]|uniref:DeoR/GlpR family DNA-binding transcription regulator n=1 Tax=Kitasatospora sp. NPDC006697 TaxID=3364020 RepID=UPI0036992256